MDAKIYWLMTFVGLYWSYCIFWGISFLWGWKSRRRIWRL